MDPAGRIAEVGSPTLPTLGCSRAQVGVMGAGGRGPRGADVEQIRVVVLVSEEPPVLNPQVAAALLRLLRNVAHCRGCKAR